MSAVGVSGGVYTQISWNEWNLYKQPNKQNQFKLIQITIPNTITSIGYQAFENCSKLTTVNLPDTITSIGDRAFSNCKSLTSINLPDKLLKTSFC